MCVFVLVQKEEELLVCEEKKGVLLVRKAGGTERSESETCYTHTVLYP